MPANRQQAGEFALAARIRLQRDRGQAGDLAQPGFELVEERLVPQALIRRREGVELGEFGPGDGHHGGGGVELHGARAQGNHRGIERQVLGLQAVEVAEHGGF